MIVYHPRSRRQESTYLAQVVFEDRLGVSVDLVESGDERWSICGGDGRELLFGASARSQIVKLDLFRPDYDGGKSRIISEEELENLEGGMACLERLKFPPRDEAKAEPVVRFFGERRCEIDADLLEAIFIILTGEPERSCSVTDRYDRHTLSNTRWILGEERKEPIVDLYIELIAKCMERIFGDFGRRQRQFRVSPSHDVDTPSLYRELGPLRGAKRCFSVLKETRSPAAAMRTFADWAAAKGGKVRRDPHYTFDWIMDESEKRSLQSTFYFITDHTDPVKDGCYSMDDPFIQKLLRDIHDRGHLIGLHPSSETYRDGAQIQREFDRLLSVCDSLGIQQDEWGTRQHCLKWRNPETARYLAAAGLAHDGTLGIANGAGFRNGTCHPFPLYDAEEEKVLSLEERPLVVMECSVIDERYAGLGTGEKALREMARLKETCRSLGGDFQILWHNNRFSDPLEKDLYTAVLDS